MENTTPNTNNFLNWVEIKNFKSIKDLRLDCKRVNVFIGKPNVGKSNILEGLGLLGAGYSDKRFLNGFVRLKRVKNLFFDNDINDQVEVITNKVTAVLEYTELYELLKNSKGHDLFDDKATFKLTTLETDTYKTRKKDGIATTGEQDSYWFINEPSAAMIPGSLRTVPSSNELNMEHVTAVKKYDFANMVEFNAKDYKSMFSLSLTPPNGVNLYSVIRRNNELWKEFADLFVEQGLELVLYDEKQEFILQKKNGPFVTQYPFFSIADTFRRFMFYITAIESNKDSVIIFEEPEVHSFPPYVKALAHRIVYSETNQFFVSTHSPYLLQTLIRELDPADLSVFITYYKDYQTHVRALTADELQEAEDLSIDLFYNLSRYEPNA